MFFFCCTLRHLSSNDFSSDFIKTEIVQLPNLILNILQTPKFLQSDHSLGIIPDLLFVLHYYAERFQYHPDLLDQIQFFFSQVMNLIVTEDIQPMLGDFFAQM
jgi:hypothetical protein